MSDATFEEGGEAPLRLLAEDEDDLSIISSLVQDSVLPGSEIRWQKRNRRFAALLNRFRWEDRLAAERRKRPYERVQSLLVIDDVQRVQSQGVDPQDENTIISVLSITFEPGEDGSGRLLLTLAGDGAIALDVECINVTLRDVTRPYLAPSRSAPEHPE